MKTKLDYVTIDLDEYRQLIKYENEFEYLNKTFVMIRRVLLDHAFIMFGNELVCGNEDAVVDEILSIIKYREPVIYNYMHDAVMAREAEKKEEEEE